MRLSVFHALCRWLAGGSGMEETKKIASHVATTLWEVVAGVLPRRWRYKPRDLSGETVLVTGAAGDLGGRLARHLASVGVRRFVLWDLRAPIELAEELSALPGGQAWAYACDLAERREVYAVAARVKSEAGRVTLLINNAGVVTGKRFLDCSDDDIELSFRVNAMSHCWMYKAFLPAMLEAGQGHIVCVASMAGKCGAVRLADYSASKFAAVGLEEALRLELWAEGHEGIRSTIVCPYYMQGAMFSGVDTGRWLPLLNPDEVAQEVVQAIRYNEEVLLLPKIFNFLLLLKALLPVGALKESLLGLGITPAMNSFKGAAVTHVHAE